MLGALCMLLVAQPFFGEYFKTFHFVVVPLIKDGVAPPWALLKYGCSRYGFGSFHVQNLLINIDIAIHKFAAHQSGAIITLQKIVQAADSLCNARGCVSTSALRAGSNLSRASACM